MPHLYVANVTKQTVNFAYRALERSGVVIQNIPIGGQVRIAPNGTSVDLTTPEIDYILNQHRKYGITGISELDTSRGPFTGICYSIGKPITVEKLQKAMRRNEEVLNALGKQMRQEAALAVNSQIESQIGAPLNNFEMSVVEEEPRSGYSEDLTHISEGVRVTRKANGSGESNGSSGLPSIGRRKR